MKHVQIKTVITVNNSTMDNNKTWVRLL